MQTRAVILGLDDEPVVKATIPECYNIQAVSTTTAGMSELNRPLTLLAWFDLRVLYTRTPLQLAPFLSCSFFAPPSQHSL